MKLVRSRNCAEASGFLSSLYPSSDVGSADFASTFLLRSLTMLSIIIDTLTGFPFEFDEVLCLDLWTNGMIG
jgi:hypothetical protein